MPIKATSKDRIERIMLFLIQKTNITFYIKTKNNEQITDNFRTLQSDDSVSRKSRRYR